MKWFVPLFGAVVLLAQTPQPPAVPGAPASQPAAAGATLSARDAGALETRMLQLMESTAVAVPGLVRASEPVKQNAEMTFAATERTPQNPALLYQFINQVKAYLALSESIPRPFPFPETADRQFAELHADLQRIQQHFEAILRVREVTVVQQPQPQSRDADPANLGRYADADAQTPPPGKLPRVVFMGDSITEAWRLNEYFTGRDFINRGIGGQTTSQMLTRFLQDVIALRPRVVVIMGGINDIGRGYAPKGIEQNLEIMGDLAKSHGVKPIFASVLPVGDDHKSASPRYQMTKTHSPAEISQLNSWIKSYCAREKFIYVDYYSVMADYKGQMQADLSDDGLHPNAKGYRVMSPIALEAIGRVAAGAYLEQGGAQQPKRRVRMLGK